MQDESVATPAARCSTSADGDLTRRQRTAVVISSFDSPGNPHYGGGGANMVEMIARWLAADAAGLRRAYAELAGHFRCAAMGMPPALPRIWHV